MRLLQSVIDFFFVRTVNFLTIGMAIMILGIMPVGASIATSQLACTPTNLGFGDVVVGHTKTLLVILTNDGQSSVTVSGIAVGKSEFTTSILSLPLVLLAGQSIDLSVSFTPTASGWMGGTIKFSSTASNATLRLDVGGTGASSEAVTAIPSTVFFGQVTIGTISTVPVVLTNARSKKVTLSALQTTGGGFSTSGPSFPLTLGPGQSVTEDVAFAPKADGKAEGKLFISGPGLAIPLTGTGTAPAVVVEVTPTNVSATVGATQQFTASVTGTGDTAVVWTVSGVGCNGTACGTISSSGLYTAPASVPSPATVIATATSAAAPTESASADVTIVPTVGTSYYLAPADDGGNDSNNGLSSDAPWLTPNHAVNCGDVLTAAAGTYSDDNFQDFDWGTVTCVAENNVAWVKCATFDACKINSRDGHSGIQIGRSYWGIQGFEVTTGGGNNYAACFNIYPRDGVTIHHIIFANDIANGCEASGIAMSNSSTTAGYDYVAIIGNIAYNAAQTNTICGAGFGFYQPIASDSLPGTHLYIAGNFGWDNVVPNPCGGNSPPFDGEGVSLDTLDGSQGGLASPYNQQVVVENNIMFLNGATGVGVIGGGNTAAPVYLVNNTVYGNAKDSNQNGPDNCGQITLATNPNQVLATQVYNNLAVTDQANGGQCGSGNPKYTLSISEGNGTDHIDHNFGYSTAGNNTQNVSSIGFSYGPNNIFGTNPGLASVADPGAPSCRGYANVPACMATVIANFTPTKAAAIGYGYQVPSSNPVYDPLFPQWLCSVRYFPTGLVTLGCT